MRPSLVVTGLFIAGLGLALYVLEIPLVFNWSLPFMVGGLVFVAVGAVVKEAADQIEPPVGYVFCVFCNTPIPTGTKKCDRCNGAQPN